jgi:hypothetical protein
MNMGRFTRMKVGAPVAVVLATVVNAASACDPATMPKPVAAPDLSWALNCGATAAGNTRTLLAERAAKTIHSLDRYFGAEPGYTPYIVPVQSVEQTIWTSVVLAPSQLHIDSNHQHAAP